jgi:hypothetical protein
MRTSVIITKRGDSYISQVAGKFGGGHRGVTAGKKPYEAAVHAARMMIEYAQTNSEGGDLMAPPEVLDHVPLHLRVVKDRSDSAAALGAAGGSVKSPRKTAAAAANGRKGGRPKKS